MNPASGSQDSGYPGSREQQPSTHRFTGGNWCCTDVDKHNATLHWTLNNFPDYAYKNGERVQSSKFMSSDNKLEWRVDLYPKGVKQEYDEHVSLFLHSSKRGNSTEKLRADVSFRLMNAQRLEIKHVTYKNCFFESGKSVGCPSLMPYAALIEKLLENNGCLIVLCEVTAIRLAGAKTVGEGSFPTPRPVTEGSSLKSDLTKLLSSEQFSDVVIVVSGQEFKLHKNILSARSDVFHAMFANEFRELKESRVEIDGIEPRIFKAFLDYMYAEDLSRVSEYPDSLLIVADRYQVIGLKAACENELIRQITNETVCDLILLSDCHNADAMKKAAMEWIKCNYQHVISSDNWKMLVKNNPSLASSILLFCTNGSALTKGDNAN